MATYLDRILAAHRKAAGEDHRPLGQLVDSARQQRPARGFRAALQAASGLAVIAEIKRRSPSKGDLTVGLDPADLAMTYEDGGARCLSVLTDREFFGGSPDDLGRHAVPACPVLRKDFTVHARDVCDARLMGADCVLLIVAALADAELRRFHDLAVEIGLDVLVEVHDEPELERALAIGATLVGVNQRDLVTFAVDPSGRVRMAAADPARGRAGGRVGRPRRRRRPPPAAAGYDAMLVGETLVTSPDPARTIQLLKGD